MPAHWHFRGLRICAAQLREPEHGLKLTLMQAVAYFVQWTIIGIVIGLIYKPLATP
jgi:hypothetical protein